MIQTCRTCRFWRRHPHHNGHRGTCTGLRNANVQLPPGTHPLTPHDFGCTGHEAHSEGEHE